MNYERLNEMCEDFGAENNVRCYVEESVFPTPIVLIEFDEDNKDEQPKVKQMLWDANLHISEDGNGDIHIDIPEEFEEYLESEGYDELL